MKLDDMFPKRFATGADLQGRSVTLTIANVTREKMHPRAGQPAIEKFVVWFEEAEKGVILSRTLANQIDQAVSGAGDTDNWKGQRVTLYPVPLKVAGQDRIAIRAKKATNGEPPPPTLDE